jgi:hypothetical protein
VGWQRHFGSRKAAGNCRQYQAKTSIAEEMSQVGRQLDILRTLHAAHHAVAVGDLAIEYRDSPRTIQRAAICRKPVSSCTASDATTS